MCYVAFETADDLSAGFAFTAAPLVMLLGAFVATQPGEHDVSQSVVGLLVAVLDEVVPHDITRKHLEGASTAQSSVKDLTVYALRVVTGCDEQCGGYLHGRY